MMFGMQEVDALTGVFIYWVESIEVSVPELLSFSFSGWIVLVVNLN